MHDELQQPLPRHVREDPAWRMLLALVAAVFWGPAGLILFLLFLDSHSIAHLKATGKDTVAVVTSMRSDQIRSKERQYNLGYIFVPQTRTSLSRSYTGNASLSASEFSALTVGDTLAVTYDPGSPSNSRLRSELDGGWAHPYARFFRVAEVTLLVLVLSTALSAAYVRRQYVWERRLVQWGSLAPAIIVAERDVIIAKTRRTRVTYQFRDTSGLLVTGTRSDLPSQKELRDGYEHPYYSAVTDNPIVLHDPRDSSRNLLYPPAMMRCIKPP